MTWGRPSGRSRERPDKILRRFDRFTGRPYLKEISFCEVVRRKIWYIYLRYFKELLDFVKENKIYIEWLNQLNFFRQKIVDPNCLRCKVPAFNFLWRNQILNVLNHTQGHSGTNPPPRSKISHKTSISDLVHSFNTDFTITPLWSGVGFHSHRQQWYLPILVRNRFRNVHIKVRSIIWSCRVGHYKHAPPVEHAPGCYPAKTPFPTNNWEANL